MNIPAAFIGPTVCELDGPMPTLNRSKTLIVMAALHPELFARDFTSERLRCGRR